VGGGGDGRPREGDRQGDTGCAVGRRDEREHRLDPLPRELERVRTGLCGVVVVDEHHARLRTRRGRRARDGDRERIAERAREGACSFYEAERGRTGKAYRALERAQACVSDRKVESTRLLDGYGSKVETIRDAGEPGPERGANTFPRKRDEYRGGQVD